MILTLVYIYLTIKHGLRRKHYREVIMNNFKRWLSTQRHSFAFQRILDTKTRRIYESDVLLHNSACGTFMTSTNERTLLNLDEKWTLFIGAEERYHSKVGKESAYLLIEAVPTNEGKLADLNLVLKSSDLSSLAWKSGEPYGLLIQCRSEDLVKLGTAFMENQLVFEDGLQAQRLMLVDVSGEPFRLVSEEIAEPPKMAERTSSDVVVGSSHAQPAANSGHSIHQKPPNILVYAGASQKAQRNYESTKEALEMLLNFDNYAIYWLQHQQVLTQAWAENTTLLVITSTERLTQDVSDRFTHYFKQGGRVLSLTSFFSPCPSLLPEPNSEAVATVVNAMYSSQTLSAPLEFETLATGYTYTIPVSSQLEIECLAYVGEKPALLFLKGSSSNNGGQAILSQIHLVSLPLATPSEQSPVDFVKLKTSGPDRFTVMSDLLRALQLSLAVEQPPALTPSLLLFTHHGLQQEFTGSLEANLQGDRLDGRNQVTFVFTEDWEQAADINISRDLVAVVGGNSQGVSLPFDFEEYKRNLKSRVLGNTLLYTEVVPTTMSLVDGLYPHMSENVGLIAIASRQTAGKGRGGNCWLSPLGCAMFSLHVRIPLHSELGQKMPYLQHIVSVSVVEAVKLLPGYQDIDLKLKWPNDIYFGKNIKIGGVIVNTTLTGDMFHANIGCGFNVSNSDPTLCINDLITDFNQREKTQLELLTPEQLIARTVNGIERWIRQFNVNGMESFLATYYQLWLHSGSKVHLYEEDGPVASVMGLDNHGYLAVRTHQGDIQSVQPDGNSFDMLKNLILTKS